MKIVGAEGLTSAEVQQEVADGARFILYGYCISLLVVTFKRSSNIYFVRAGESTFARGLPFTLISLVAGWWGIPWGPIYTVQTIAQNLQGGRDVTSQVLAPARSTNSIAPKPGT